MPQRLVIECLECGFQRSRSQGDGDSADLIIEHGRDTGHTLTVEVADG